jgi:hypothetical protein
MKLLQPTHNITNKITPNHVMPNAVKEINTNIVDEISYSVGINADNNHLPDPSNKENPTIDQPTTPSTDISTLITQKPYTPEVWESINQEQTYPWQMVTINPIPNLNQIPSTLIKLTQSNC